MNKKIPIQRNRRNGAQPATPTKKQEPRADRFAEQTGNSSGSLQYILDGIHQQAAGRLQNFEVYYNESAKDYWVRAADGEFIRCNETGLRKRLQLIGVGDNQIDETVIRFQDNNYIRYAGPLAGFWSGRYVIHGVPVLATASPRLIEPTYGDNMIVRDYIDRLLGRRQAAYVHAYFKIGYAEFRAKTLRRGPVLILVGKRDQGKSLFVSKIFVSIFGGRKAEPQQGMEGGTTFNKDWFGAESLVMDDPGSDDQHGTRKKFADAIKQMCGNEAPRCHGKHLDPIVLTPFWRMVVTLNDQLEDIQVLPPLSNSMLDKVIILMTERRAVDCPTSSPDDYVRFGESLVNGVSDYLGWLETWQLPIELRNKKFGFERWGFSCYQHPAIMASLKELTPEERVKQMVDAVLFVQNRTEQFEGTAFDVERELLSDETGVGQAARSLFRSSKSIGKYLSRLCDDYPDQFTKLAGPTGRMPGGNVMRYRIIPPTS